MNCYERFEPFCSVYLFDGSILAGRKVIRIISERYIDKSILVKYFFLSFFLISEFLRFKDFS